MTLYPSFRNSSIFTIVSAVRGIVKGGEGKSYIELVIRSLLGDSMNTTSIQKVREMVYQQKFEEVEKAIKQRKKELEKEKKRIAELDRIFKRIYEDDINGIISHERFLTAEYEAEQKELTEFGKAEQAAADNEFVKKIIVHARTNPVDTADRR
ncbi:MAG: hypothetical protein Q4F41_15885 [Eubacteriales bacterium]|nr:hypothetical protein [Eubacteriales bacterium]